MLRSLHIKNVVLIQELSVEFEKGYNVLTGETGAGKSILLNALGLVLGARGDKGLLREGADKAVVSAVFEIDFKAPVREKLTALDIDHESCPELIIRRSLTHDGKSKSFINDQPVALGALKSVAEDLVELHGQFDRILDVKTHRMHLDRFGMMEDLLGKVRHGYKQYALARRELREFRENIDLQRNHQEYLTHALEEIGKLAPEPAEEEKLVEQRHRLKHREKVQGIYEQVQAHLGAESGVTNLLGQILTLLERNSDFLAPEMAECLPHLSECHDRLSHIEKVTSCVLQGNGDDICLEEIEDRLYALRSLARKHNVPVAELSDFQCKLEMDLKAIEHSDDHLLKLKEQVESARENFLKLSQDLSLLRQEKAQILGDAIMQELTPLKLEHASFRINVFSTDEKDWNEFGIDQVSFEVRTNPGQPFGAIDRIASGGERSRFMLAMKVVLAARSGASILIFDEIDSGVGGAVAAAIGERMARLGEKQQVLAITHSPQVASYASTHFHVHKGYLENVTTTDLTLLQGAKRIEEIASMLSAGEVTEASRLAAQQLLGSALKKAA